MQKNIVLIGMMGSGKTTIGRLLSRELGRDLVDTDSEIVSRTGMSVEDIFARYGEDWFRAKETEILRELMEQEGLVISVGGGLPLREENRRLLEPGVTIFLRRDPEVIWETVDLSGRPLAKNGKAAFIELSRQREPLYALAADTAITGATPRDVVGQIKRYLQEQEDAQ